MKILFVDDEKIIRDSMQGVINWEKVGCTKLVLAESAARAIELMQSERFELVITDIFMQRMNGVELAKYIRAQYPETRIIILSAFEDFNMARGAIEAGVIQYLLKPIVPEELESAILRATQEIQASEKLHTGILETEKMVRLYKPVVEESFWRTLLLLEAPGEAKLDRMMELHGIGSIEEDLTCILVSADSPMDEVVLTRLEHISLGILPAMLSSVRMSEFECALIAGGDVQSQELEKLHAYWADALGQSVSVVLGRSAAGARNLSDSYRDARRKKALFTAMRLNELDSSRVYERALKQEPGLERMLRDIKVGITYGSKTVQKKVEQYLSRLEEAGLGDKARSLLEGRMLLDVHALLEEHGAHQPSVSEFIRRYVEFSARAEKISFFTNWLDRYGAPLRAQDGSSPKMMAEGVRKYIEANFRDPELSVASIAEAFHVSHAYLSRLYRKEYSQTCIECITSLRIDYAKSLLENTDIHHSDVAEEVGYSSVYYFSIQFKKMMGETPGEYRRRRRIENENPHDTEG